MSTNDAAREKLSWIQLVARDHRVSPAAVRLAVVIAGYVHRDTGDAWPSHARLAGDIGMTDRSVRSLVDKLVSAGFITVTSGGGRKVSNRYRLTNPEAQFRLSDGKPGNAIPGLQTETRKSVALNPEISRAKTRKPTSDEPVEEPIEEPIEDIETSFTEFWNRYPRHVAKHAADRAFAKVIKSGKASVAEVLAGVDRYAAERQGQDPKFTKHPSTWLNGGCWADELSNPRHFSAPGRRVTGMAGILELVDGDHQPDEVIE